MQEGHAITGGNGSEVRMIAENQSDLSFEFSGLLALQKVLEAMRQARGEQGDFRRVIAEMEFELHAELFGQRMELRRNLVAGDLESVKMELEARQEDPGFEVGVLIRLENVAAVAKNEAGDTRNQALLVRAGH